MTRYFLRTGDNALITLDDPNQPVPPDVARPVLVLDPTDRATIHDLVQAYLINQKIGDVEVFESDIDEMSAALRSMLPAIDQPVYADSLPEDSPFRSAPTQES